jgi:hypothetical protein
VGTKGEADPTPEADASPQQNMVAGKKQMIK